jgi:hypothetical protein
MENEIGKEIINEIAGVIDIPENAYKKAISRYENVAAWFADSKATCNKYDPHIYTQGSFRLGIAIRPFHNDGEYDLDMGCRLRKGVTKGNCSQKTLKDLVGNDVEAYRLANGIQQRREEKHRCWRLKYADEMAFHLDVVPSIPEDDGKRIFMKEALGRAGMGSELANRLAQLTGAITDNRDANYAQINPNWRLSNSEGFALWFESRMEIDTGLKGRLLLEARAAKVDRVPTYRWKSPLQRAVQILKAHRDLMFKNDPDSKPASIILTTLAARGYGGEADVRDALAKILSAMPTLVAANNPRVPNPVNPAEDFADRWTLANGLEGKFRRWLVQAKQDFEALARERKPELIVEAAKSKFGATLNLHEITAKLQAPNAGLLRAAAVPGGLSFPDKPLVPQKPAGFANLEVKE